MSKEIKRCEFGVFYKDMPPIIAEPSDDYEEMSKKYRELRKEWHVVMNLMSTPGYRAEKDPNNSMEGFEFSPWFKTKKEAQDWIDQNT